MAIRNSRVCGGAAFFCFAKNFDKKNVVVKQSHKTTIIDTNNPTTLHNINYTTLRPNETFLNLIIIANHKLNIIQQ